MAEPDGKKKDGQDGDAGTGMDFRDLKRALARSRREKMNVALAQGDPKTGGNGLVLIDKVMPPKQVMRNLKDQFPKSRTPCFGTVSIDMDVDPKLVTFKVNKRIPGLNRRLRKTLKGTGFTKVNIEVGGGREP